MNGEEPDYLKRIKTPREALMMIVSCVGLTSYYKDIARKAIDLLDEQDKQLKGTK